MFLKFMAGTTGLEPATSAVTGQRSNQLSYRSITLPGREEKKLVCFGFFYWIYCRSFLNNSFNWSFSKNFYGNLNY